MRRILHGTFLNLRDAGRNGNHHTWSPESALARLLDFLMSQAVAEHFLRNIAVAYNTTLHRTYNDKVARRLANHLSCLCADGENTILVVFTAGF